MRISSGCNPALPDKIRLVHILPLLFLLVRISAGVCFKSEIIEILIVENTFEVRGTYVFDTCENRPEPLHEVFYPIPSESDLTFPLDFKVEHGRNNMPFKPDHSGKGFFIPIPSQVACTLIVKYSQENLNRKGKYILTSTRHWKAPLQSGEYIIRYRSPVQLQWCSYKADSVFQDGSGATCYTWKKIQFMPDKDIDFSWTLKRPEADVKATGSQ